MRIQNIQSYNTKYPAFKAWERVVKNPGDDTVKHKNNTYLFRKDFNWENFIYFIDDKYKKVPKVNVYDYACSNGSEAYTLLITLMENLPKEDVKKFLPIIAKDYDSYAIHKAKKHKIPIGNDEIQIINLQTGNNLEKYFSFYNNNLYSAQSNLTNNVNFHVADIKKDIKNIKPNNSIVLARNFWPYLDNYYDRKKLLQDLYNRFGENCLLVIGLYDKLTDCNMENLLKETGFKQVDKAGRVFEK